MGFGYRLKSAVVVLPATADLFDTVFAAVQMHHFMQHGVQRFFNGIVQNLGGNIQLVCPAVFPLPHLGRGAMAVCPRLALHGDNRHGQLCGKVIRVQAVIDVLQLTDGSAHFGGFFHGVFLHPV